MNEVRRQFREIPGIMEGTGRPDYARCVDLSTRGALREMILPGIMAVAVPLLVGFLLGAEALGGLLIGAVGAGFILAITMANAGGTWDNAKKYIELGHYGGKGLGASQGRGGRRPRGRSLQGYVRTITEHPAQVDGNCVAGVRASVAAGGGWRRALEPPLGQEQRNETRPSGLVTGRTCGLKWKCAGVAQW